MPKLLSPQRPANDAEVFARGAALHRAGHFRQAEACYQTVLHRNPAHADALNAMGALSIEAGQPTFAINFFERALQQQPDDFRYLNNLGNVLVDVSRTEEGLPYLEKALKLQPASYELLLNIGRSYRKMGMAERGLPLLRRAVTMRPGDGAALMLLADSLAGLGQYEEAEKLYRAAVKRGGAKADGLFGLAMSGRRDADGSIAVEIDREIATPGQTTKAYTNLHYAAAKVRMDQKRPTEAWPHLVAANSLSAVRYDMERHDQRQRAMLDLFHPAFVASRRGYGSPSEQPIFIVGMPRSGTSLTEQILSSHPQVFGAGELNYMHTLANRLFYGMAGLELFADKVRALTPAAVNELADGYLAKTAYFSKDALRITDKMPHNFSLLGLIALLFPHARILFCRRDPLDNCFSIFSNALNDAHSYGNDLETLGRYYRRHIELMDHWKAVLGDQIMEVQYERLVDDLQGMSHRMVAFLGLPWDDACLRFFDNDRAVSTISKWQVRQPIYKTSVARWRPYAKYLDPLVRGLGDLIVPGVSSF